MVLKRLLVGLPLKTSERYRERLSKRLGLAVFSSDALSSVAYATEEILRVLIIAGSTALAWSLPLSLTIISLLLILTISYRQTIFEYPSGGGAYIVAKANIGELAGLTAAAALMIDYVLTVTVSVTAGVGALTSAAPGLNSHRVLIDVVLIVLLVLVNLRGLRQAGFIFAIPTYGFISAIGLLLIAGAIQIASGTAPVALPGPEAASGAAEGLTLFLLLRAFSSGCTALTGVEAISNGVQAFRRPEARNAAATMASMAAILGSLFLGISWLAYSYGARPSESETVLSQIAHAVLGDGALYYFVQIATMLILIVAANTSFADFPRLSALLARDGFMPRQMTNQGDRLVFSNGIMILGLFACVLAFLFGGDTHALIPLYAIGVFLSFTLSQAGMVRHWMANRTPRWRRNLAINGVGAIVTGIATAIIAITKFSHGAWIVIGLIPMIILAFRTVRGHYACVAEQIAVSDQVPPVEHGANQVILPISYVNQAVVQALDYLGSQSATMRAVVVDTNHEETAKIQQQWRRWGKGVSLVVLSSPYRSVIGPLIHYIEELLVKDPTGWVTVVIPEILPAHWWQGILHNQRALLLKAALLLKDRVIVIDVPYHLKR